MAGGSARIGALHVALGIDSAQFTSGLANAQGGLGKFRVLAVAGFAAIGAAGIAAGYALTKALGGAIDKFDEMGKAAQKVGTTTEALSRLSYAASLSDVSFEQLTGGLARLSKGMADVATGSAGPAATAFAALGISITNAAGQMRGSDEVFADVAEKFSRMEDGSTKTALAMGIFGKAGAEMIPLLNSGRSGLADMADEADRLGVTIGGSAAKNAEIFNDNITRVQAALSGIVNRITEAALPVFSYLSEAFVNAAGNGKLMEGFANGFVFVLKSVVTVAAVAATTVSALGEAFATLMTAGSMASMGMQNWGAAALVLQGGFANVGESIKATTDFINGLWAATAPADGEGGGGIVPFVANMDALANSTTAAKDAAKALKDEMAEAQSVFDATRTPFEQMQIDLQSLDTLLADGRIGWETYGRAVGSAMADAAANTLGSLASLSAGLSGAFEDNKVLAVATAVLKGAEAVASAFAAGNALGGPIIGAAFAGVAAITAAANVAAVMATTPTSTSMSGAGGSSSAPAVSSAAAPAAAPQNAVNVTLKGNSFGREGIRALLEEIGEYTSDGSAINVSFA